MSESSKFLSKYALHLFIFCDWY